MPKIFTSEKQKIGEIGENIATKFLVKHSFSIIERNYTKKWGEIDIIAKKGEKLYFIEVKSVTCATIPNVSRETQLNRSNDDSYRPEDNMHPWKLRRLARTIQTYMVSNRISEDTVWQVDLLVVYLDMVHKKAVVKVVPDIIL